MNQQLLEVLGYAASVLVAVSLTMRSILRLRIINLIGSVVFAIYGYLIGAWPVAGVNAFIACVNLYFLSQMFGSREYFRLLPVTPDDEYLRYFLDFSRKEIERYEPSFKGMPEPSDVAVFILRNLVPAGLLIGTQNGATLRIKLDYALPGYRDFKLGSYVYADPDGFFRQRGIREVVAPAETSVHSRYLQRMGFTPVASAGGESLYRLELH